MHAHARKCQVGCRTGRLEGCGPNCGRGTSALPEPVQGAAALGGEGEGPTCCRERILGLPAAPDKRNAPEELLAYFLPLDEQRREESALWLAFVTASRTRPELRPRAQKLYDGMYELIAHILREAQRAGGVAADADLTVEARHLYALLDGLALQATLWPERLTPPAMRQMLRRHLTGLTTRA